MRKKQWKWIKTVRGQCVSSILLQTMASKSPLNVLKQLNV